mgnify:CR=1 FL=1
MQRIVYLMDRFMQKFGMSGKSVVPMISGLACAIPAIMAARTIENNKERLITILITPLLTCSARIPVYVVIIALVIPDNAMLGIFNAQGLALMGMYLLGILLSLISALVFKWILKRSEEHTSELQSRGLISYAVFCLKKKKQTKKNTKTKKTNKKKQR